jgi:hypothetical protein
VETPRLFLSLCVAAGLFSGGSGIVGLRTAWLDRATTTATRFSDVSRRSWVRATVMASTGFLWSPVTRLRCVFYALRLTRTVVQERRQSGVLDFRAYVPFFLVDNTGERKDAPQDIAVAGFDALPQPLPTIPAGVEGLLIERFGRRGIDWARDHAVDAQELLVKDGASVLVLIENGAAKLLRPATDDERAPAVSIRDGVMSLVTGAVLLMGALFLW